MTFEYCETCKKVTFGGCFPSATLSIKVFLCSICNAITYMVYMETSDDEALIDDIELRNEAIKLQLQYYKALNKNKRGLYAS